MEPNSRLKNFKMLYFSATGTGDLQEISHHIVMAVVRSLTSIQYALECKKSHVT
jgi:hypothetical protein